MPIQPAFYELLRVDPHGDGYRAEARLDPRHAIYGGHFPGHPVTPGVGLLAILREAIGLALGHPVRFAAIRSCKFTAPAIPADDEILTLEFTLGASSDVRGTAAYRGETVLKLTATVTPTASSIEP